MLSTSLIAKPSDLASVRGEAIGGGDGNVWGSASLDAGRSGFSELRGTLRALRESSLDVLCSLRSSFKIRSSQSPRSISLISRFNNSYFRSSSRMACTIWSRYLAYNRSTNCGSFPLYSFASLIVGSGGAWILRFFDGLTSPGMSPSSSLFSSSRNNCRYSSRRASGLRRPGSYRSLSRTRTLLFSSSEIRANTFGSVPKAARDWNNNSDSSGV